MRDRKSEGRVINSVGTVFLDCRFCTNYRSRGMFVDLWVNYVCSEREREAGEK